MKRVAVYFIVASILFAVPAASQVTNITFEDIRMKGNNTYADVITKEFYKSLKAYGLYRFYPQGVFLANDLSDTSNYLYGNNDTLRIYNSHVYHIYAPWESHKVSIIMIPIQESLFFFIGLNCCKPKHRLTDVLYWMREQDGFSSTVYNRVENYNSYYFGSCMDIPGCDCECLEQREHSCKRFRKPYKMTIRK